MGENKCITCGSSIPEGRMICYSCEYPIEPSLDTAKIKIQLNGIREVSIFTHYTSKCKCDVVIKSGRFVVNAKSIMGILSLDLTKTLNLEFYGDIPCETIEGIKNFIIN